MAGGFAPRSRFRSRLVCVDAPEALTALAAAADALLMACTEQGLSSTDIDALRAARNALRH